MYEAPIMAPIDVPQITSGSMPSRLKALSTPMCDQPRDAPLPSASPMRVVRGLFILVFRHHVEVIAGSPGHVSVKASSAIHNGFLN